MSCPSTQYYNDRLYEPEIWTWFGVGTFITLARLVIRLRQVGLRDFQGDDYLAIVVWACFAGKSVALTLVFLYGSNMDYDAEAVVRLKYCQVERVVLGSQMELLAWFVLLSSIIHRMPTNDHRRSRFTYISIIWGLKGMVLFIFDRLRLNTDRRWLFQMVTITTCVTYAAMFLTLCLGCLPFVQNWQVSPPPPPQCSMRMHDIWASTILNVFTDLMILTIPIPTLWGSRFSTGKKIGLTLLLCSGLFVMSAAVIRFGFVIVGSTSVNLNKWCQRETTVGIIAVNMPVLWTWLNPLLPRAPRQGRIRIDWPRPKTRSLIVEEQPSPRVGILTSCPDDDTRIDSKLQKTSSLSTTEIASDMSDAKRSDSQAKSSTTAAISFQDSCEEMSSRSHSAVKSRLPS